jgi:hypothetical protein
LAAGSSVPVVYLDDIRSEIELLFPIARPINFLDPDQELTQAAPNQFNHA